MKKPTALNYLAPLIMIGLGLLRLWHHGLDAVSIIPIVLGVFALYLALFNHLLLQRVLDFLMKLWYPIGQFITIVLLTMMFYFVFAPVGIILKLFKKDILNKDFKKDRLTYWLDRPAKEQNNYTQQF